MKLTQDILVGEGSRATAAPMPATFVDRFLLEEAVAAGGGCVVWRARDLKAASAVALKFFPPALVREPAGWDAARELTGRLQRERQPGWATAQEVVTDGKFAAFVSPWIGGPTLRKMMQAQPARVFHEQGLRRWLVPLLGILEDAHARGVVHGALNPDVVLQQEGELYVTGFAVNAWLREAMAQRGRVATPGEHVRPYLSPAVLRGEPARAADDIYALGATIYELLTGVPPHPGGWWRRHRLPVAMARLRRHQGNGQRLEPLSVAWERTILRCLEPRERDRLGSVRELRLRLDLPPPEPRSASMPAAIPGVTARGSAPAAAGGEAAPASVATTPDAGAPPGAAAAATASPEDPSKGAARPAGPAGLTRPPLRGATPPDTRALVPVAPPAGVFWLRVLCGLAAVATIAVGSWLGWSVYQRHGGYEQLLASVRAFPSSARTEERAAMEQRVDRMRRYLTPRQWRVLRETWTDKTASPPSAAEQTSPAPTTVPPPAEPPMPEVAEDDAAPTPADAVPPGLEAPPAEAPAVAAPLPASIYVASDPPGAELHIAELPAQRTPFVAQELPPGIYPVQVTLPGYAPFATTLDVKAGETAAVRAKLERLSGVLHVASDPAGVAFTVRDPSRPEPVARGSTPAELSLPVGRYEIDYASPGGAGEHAVVEVTTDRAATAQLTLPRPEPEIAAAEPPPAAEPGPEASPSDSAAVTAPAAEDTLTGTQAAAAEPGADTAVTRDESAATEVVDQPPPESAAVPADEPVAVEAPGRVPTPPPHVAGLVTERPPLPASPTAPPLSPEATPSPPPPSASPPEVRETPPPARRTVESVVPPAEDSTIFELADVDQPPRVTHRVDPVLERRIRGNRPQRVEIEVVIDRFGRVASAVVRASTSSALAEPSLRAVRRWRFRPAVKNGETVAVRIAVPLVFTSP